MQSRFGPNWRDHLPAKFDMVSIKELIDHVIDEGNRLFADTRFAKTWLIYHDALPQWWEKGAQDHIRARGFEHRQWRARGDTNNHVAAHYRGRLMGDSPELMPLDSSLFGDLIETVARLVVSTKHLGDGERFSMATPDLAWRTITAAWELVRPERIVEDIARFETALEAIIAAEGAYVDEYDLRVGHRATMQRLVRGGAIRGVSEGQAATEAIVEAALAEAMASWEGLTAKI